MAASLDVGDIEIGVKKDPHGMLPFEVEKNPAFKDVADVSHDKEKTDPNLTQGSG
eukprot:CAMPEP_0202969680 /NCGR_PEP_ID=MMETSP1396-20130829/15523_1 /ASSEMBLY_ACC=CAM_ASM_000872 /TAXON_ID= /ORGANISM="Pseudokeronopsis sp., Strain Brazil" /LENGTH=54 /DNA_ID=CAMNT_0049697529 /DNA_START=630 /DNA_END=794 /DNA_ORIENTATION=-